MTMQSFLSSRYHLRELVDQLQRLARNWHYTDLPANVALLTELAAGIARAETNVRIDLETLYASERPHKPDVS